MISCSAAALRWRREAGGWRLEHVGGAIAEIVGCEAEALWSGEPEWWTLVDGPDAREAVNAAPAGTRALTLRPALRHADGTSRHVVEQIDIERDRHGRAVGFTSVLVRVEAEQAASAGIGVLAYVSHEVRTPLTGILGLAETLSRSPLSPDQRRLVTALREAGAALMGVVNEALDLSRAEAGAAKLVETEFRLGALCRSVADLHAGGGRPDGPALRVVGQHMDVALLGDAAKLRQVLSNLVGNAVKFTPRGVVEIAWRCEPAARPGGVLARVSVRDTGVGIAPEAAARLFRPFAQTPEGEAAGGAGIGLAISRSLVEVMGGRLWFESVPGEGSTFHVEAPFKAALEAACAVVDDEARLATLSRRIAGASPRLLVAEDCQSNRYLLEVMLRPLGARLDFVGDGAAAIERLFADRFDAVLMDSRMPVMTGVEATAEIRRLERRRGGAHTPIIAISADSERLSRAAFEAAGADEHVAKPFTADRLLGVLDKVLSRESVMGSAARLCRPAARRRSGDTRRDGGGGMDDARKPAFWRSKTLAEMSRPEWESLCDGCGRCCLIKLEDEDDGDVAYTSVACRLFDPETCRCGSYALRAALVPGCVVLTPETLPEAARWMPETCAYRLLHEGRDLPEWHPLVTGDPGSTEAAGMSVRGWTTPEWEVQEEDLEDHILPGFR